MRNFESRLGGGHPNSLGNTVEIVDEILASPDDFDEFFNCYFSNDEVVRLRVSNGMKRIGKANREILIPYLDRFLNEVANIEQASTQWTLSQLFALLEKDMSGEQHEKARAIMQRNLEIHDDWIVLTQTMETLTSRAAKDKKLLTWLQPHLERLAADKRKAVSGKAAKMIAKLSKL
jgi:hypothetical protein